MSYLMKKFKVLSSNQEGCVAEIELYYEQYPDLFALCDKGTLVVDGETMVLRDFKTVDHSTPRVRRIYHCTFTPAGLEDL